VRYGGLDFPPHFEQALCNSAGTGAASNGFTDLTEKVGSYGYSRRPDLIDSGTT
jgi:hypothetical protein